MRVWERLIGRNEARADPLMSLEQWAEMFSYGGLNYPLLNTTMGAQDEEQAGTTHSTAYRTNGPVFSLVLARMQVFSQIRFQWTRFEKGEPTQLFDSAELRVLERPWPGGTTSDLLARLEMHASRAGNAYVRRTRRDRLNFLRPEWMTIVLGSQEDAEVPNEASDVEIAGYMYKPPNGRAKAFLPGEIAHYAPIPDPDNHFLGMSWITPFITDIQSDNAAVTHKNRFFRNAATPNIAIKFDPSVGKEKVLEFKEIIESDHKGVWNAWKTLYLGGGADPVTIGKDFRQLDFAVVQGQGETRLASGAAVPPSWVGFSEGLKGSTLNEGNFGASRRRFGDGTMQHLWTNVASSLEVITRPPTDGSRLWFTTRGVPFLRENAGDAATVQAQQAQTIVALVRDGFTPESAVAAITNDDWSLLVHTGLVSVQMQTPGQEPGQENGVPDDGDG